MIPLNKMIQPIWIHLISPPTLCSFLSVIIGPLGRRSIERGVSTGQERDRNINRYHLRPSNLGVKESERTSTSRLVTSFPLPVEPWGSGVRTPIRIHTGPAISSFYLSRTQGLVSRLVESVAVVYERELKNTPFFSVCIRSVYVYLLLFFLHKLVVLLFN